MPGLPQSGMLAALLITAFMAAAVLGIFLVSMAGKRRYSSDGGGSERAARPYHIAAWFLHGFTAFLGTWFLIDCRNSPDTFYFGPLAGIILFFWLIIAASAYGDIAEEGEKRADAKKEEEEKRARLARNPW